MAPKTRGPRVDIAQIMSTAQSAPIASSSAPKMSSEASGNVIAATSTADAGNEQAAAEPILPTTSAPAASA